MKSTRFLMGMPITVEIAEKKAAKKDITNVFNYFVSIDNRFSTYKKDSEISKINSGLVSLKNASSEMQEVFALSEQTKKETNGYFDIFYSGNYDPSGLVKGWAIQNAANILEKKGFKNFYIDGGGDIQVVGKNTIGKPWRVGIKNPFQQDKNVKVLEIVDMAVATSGNYIRGNHIYSPKENKKIHDIVSLTVIARNIYDADRMCTGAFAMGRKGIYFIESLPGYEGYIIDKKGIATETSRFKNYALH